MRKQQEAKKQGHGRVKTKEKNLNLKSRLQSRPNLWVPSSDFQAPSKYHQGGTIQISGRTSFQKQIL